MGGLMGGEGSSMIRKQLNAAKCKTVSKPSPFSFPPLSKKKKIKETIYSYLTLLYKYIPNKHPVFLLLLLLLPNPGMRLLRLQSMLLRFPRLHWLLADPSLLVLPSIVQVHKDLLRCLRVQATTLHQPSRRGVLRKGLSHRLDRVVPIHELCRSPPVPVRQRGSILRRSPRRLLHRWRTLELNDCFFLRLRFSLKLWNQ